MKSAQRKLTRSEQIFWEICRQQDYLVEPLPTRDKEGVRTADFRVSYKGHYFVAEIEELRPNKDDLRQIRELKETGSISTSGGATIGARARHHIREAADQLKAHIEESVPLVVVLYDNVRTADGRVAYPMYYLQPHDIATAMYGDRVVHVPLAPGVTPPPDHHGGKRTLTPDEKFYISAVAVISDHDDATIIFYHNHFARFPLPSIFFSGPQFRHLCKGVELANKPWEWKKRA